MHEDRLGNTVLPDIRKSEFSIHVMLVMDGISPTLVSNFPLRLFPSSGSTLFNEQSLDKLRLSAASAGMLHLSFDHNGTVLGFADG